MTAPTSFEEQFDRFQAQLSAAATSDPVLWLLRDSIYHDLYYARVGHDEPRRHRFGSLGWNASFLLKLVRGQLFGSKPHPNSDHARYGFLFHGSHDAHFATLLPVVREIAATEPVTVWWLALREDQLSILRGIANVTLTPIEPWARRSGWAAHECASDLAMANQSYAGLTSCFGSSPEERNELRKRKTQITETIFEYRRWKRIWMSVAPTLPQSALFVTSESTPVAKALRDVLRKQGRKIIHFLHGLPNTTHQVTNATDLCVFSASEMEWFEQRVGRDVKVRTIGNPRLEELRKSVAPVRERKIGEPFRLVYFSQTTGSYYGREQRRADLAILAGPDQQFSLRVRPHPSEPADLLGEDLAAAGITSWEFSSGSLVDDLSWCDVAATNFSTALLESAVCGRICYWMNTDGFVFASVKELYDEGVGKSISSRDQWRDEIGLITNLQVVAPAQLGEQQLKALKVIPEKPESWLERLQLSPKPTASVSR